MDSRFRPDLRRGRAGMTIIGRSQVQLGNDLNDNLGAGYDAEHRNQFFSKTKA